MSDDLSAASYIDLEHDLPGKLLWEIETLQHLFLEIRSHWAKVIGVSGPQLLILQSIKELDDIAGVPVNAVATRLHVHPTFATAQTKLLEKSGFLRRIPSEVDGRVVLMTLTKQAELALQRLSPRQQSVNEFLYADMSDEDLREIIDHFRALRKRAAKASRLLEIEDAK
jgi:DNA-binding MarR family transcriptional regulator